MSEKLNSAKEKIKDVLFCYPDARNDDAKLCYYVYKNIIPNIDDYSFKDIMFNHKRLKLPSFETIRRTRADIQNKEKLLLADDTTRLARMENEKEFHDYFIRN